MTRRRFIAVAGGGALAVTLPAHLLAQTDAFIETHRDLIADLAALGATLAPEDQTVGMSRDEVLQWLRLTLAEDPETAQWLPRLMETLTGAVAGVMGSERRFASLSSDERTAVVAHLLDEPGEARGGEWDRRIARPLIVHFHSGPGGYALVGYPRHGGASIPGDLESYTRPGQMPSDCQQC